jgi:hypothetical protein
MNCTHSILILWGVNGFDATVRPAREIREQIKNRVLQRQQELESFLRSLSAE